MKDIFACIYEDIHQFPYDATDNPAGWKLWKTIYSPIFLTITEAQ